MPEINPEKIERGTRLRVDNPESRYHGSHGRVVHVFDHQMILELEVEAGGRSLVGSFALEYLAFPKK